MYENVDILDNLTALDVMDILTSYLNGALDDFRKGKNDWHSTIFGRSKLQSV